MNKYSLETGKSFGVRWHHIGEIKSLVMRRKTEGNSDNQRTYLNHRELTLR
jgi:hypothetical protein